MIVLGDCPKCTQPVYALATGLRAPVGELKGDVFWHKGCVEDAEHEQRRDRSGNAYGA